MAENAKQVYDSLVAVLTRDEWKFDKDDEKRFIHAIIGGDDFPVEFFIFVREDPDVLQFISMLPFKVPEDKRVDAAIAVCSANYGMINGSFDFDISDGTVSFRLTSNYSGMTPTDDTFNYMIAVSASTVDNYNDKFFMLSKGMLTLQQFLEQENAD